MPELPPLDLRTASRWRAWLAKNHASSPGVWLVYHKDHTGVKSIDYDDSVREALCFGWVDSLIRRLDDERYARKFTPRKPTSKWSDSNRKRWAELQEAGRLAAAGQAATPTDNHYAPKPIVPILPSYIAQAFEANSRAWSHFQSLPPSRRKHYVLWIHTAKRPETRRKRLNESIALLAAGKKLGLK
ncbi:MAG: YdeI/OmpD-associated family protein [Acidobacteriia bacterium]|nr:YdeI/OmpD-associated family protein [Terriglobia bacterium]